MSNGPKKITELPVANTYANTDLVLLVGNVSTNATTYSVTPAVLFANVKFIPLVQLMLLHIQ